MKPIGARLSLEVVSLEYKQTPDRKDVGTESDPTFGATFEAVTFERKQIQSRKDFGTSKEPTFEAKLSANLPQRDAIAETDAAERNQPGPEQVRVSRRRHFDLVEPLAENSSLKIEQGLPTQPCSAHSLDPANRDRLQTIAGSADATTTQHECTPGRRPIVSHSALFQRPGIGASDECNRQDTSSAMQVRISEHQTHFPPSAMAVPVMTSREAGSAEEPQPTLAVLRPHEVTREPQSARHEIVHLAKTDAAEVPIPDLPQVSTMSQSVGAATTQILSAVLVDRSSEPGEASRAEARPHDIAPNDRLAGSYYRMITVQLQPASLGLVQVVLRSTDRALSVRIEVQASETHAKLDNDRSVLVERISAAGYMLDELLVVRMEGGADFEQAHYDPAAFNKAGGLTGSGSDSTPRRPRTTPTIPLETSDIASAELPSRVVAESERGAVVSSLYGTGRRPPRHV